MFSFDDFKESVLIFRNAYGKKYLNLNCLGYFNVVVLFALKKLINCGFLFTISWSKIGFNDYF